MAFNYRHIFTYLNTSKKEVLICIALIVLTFFTLYWPGSAPTVHLTSYNSSEEKYIKSDNFYTCNIDFSNSEWSEKYKKFDCFIEIDGKEYHLMDEIVSRDEKNMAFGLPDRIHKNIMPGNHKVRIIIRPSYQAGDSINNYLEETWSNTITVEY